MGACQSKSAVVQPPIKPAGNQVNMEAEQDSSSSTHILTDDNNISLRPGAVPKPPESEGSKVAPSEDDQGSTTDSDKKNKYRRGYSSGGSSEPDFGESYVFGMNDDSVAIEDNDRRSRLDRLHLSSMRNVMHANGDLTQAVVRLETPFGKPIEEIYDGVHDGAFLGEGVSGIVRLVKHKATGVQYACKVLDIGLIQTDAGLRQLRDEISIMCQLDHPNIVRIEEVYESTNTIYLLQELCLGGDLFDRLDDQTDYHYTEAQCAKLVKQMVSAVRYLHSKGVIHRDLKLENFLFSSACPDSELKMIDFGLSKHFDLGDVQHEPVGTPYTVAPEIIRGSYDEKCDIWALGVITYLLLSGETPFGGCYEDDSLGMVREKILRGDFLFEPKDIWDGVSDLSKKFVKRLLNPDPKLRPTAREVQRDEWLLTYAKKGEDIEGNKLNPRIVDALVSFKEYSEMRRFLHEVLSFTLLPEQIIELREEFTKIDTDGDGEITLAAMKEVLMNTAGGGALGGLTEEEVEDIFDALRVNKNDSTIRWHEFIAAGLSQCKVDDRNLRLAFDRLDTDRKGYISFDDLTDLLGRNEETIDSLKKMWADSMKQCKCKYNRITYDDFLILMKGQIRESHRPSLVWGDQKAALVLSEIEDSLQELSKSTHFGGRRRESETSPIPEESEEEGDEKDAGFSLEKQKRNWYHRKRSKSFDDLPTPKTSFMEENNNNSSKRSSVPNVRIRPSMVNGQNDSVRWIADEGRKPLIANREQYKKHRDLRMALLEASKDFDIKCQARRAAMEGKELGSPVEGAGLIMKRGSCTPKHVEDAHQQALLEAAVRRGGRQGHRRKRTQSDVTGMLTADAADNAS